MRLFRRRGNVLAADRGLAALSIVDAPRGVAGARRAAHADTDCLRLRYFARRRAGAGAALRSVASDDSARAVGAAARTNRYFARALGSGAASRLRCHSRPPGPVLVAGHASPARGAFPFDFRAKV